MVLTYPASGATSVRPHTPNTVGGVAYTYDTNGNLVSGGGRSYTWTAENLPATITSGATESYTYDADGERVAKVVGGATTIYFQGVFEQTIGASWKQYYSFNGQTVAMRDNAGTVTYLHSDHLGSVSLATSSTGTLASQQEFDPWGAVRSGSVGQTSLNYTGQRLDGTGLLYYHARMYDPVLARFVSADSIAPKPENPQTRNRYSYVLNNPLRFTDPTGHCSESSLDEADRSENRKCDEYKQQLSDYGVSLDNLFDWISSDLGLIMQAVSDLRNAAGWSVSDFRAAMGGGVNLLRASASFLGYAAVQNNGQITFYDSAFASPAGTADSLRIIVHEFAHRWDEASGSKLTHTMVGATGGSHHTCIDAFGWCDVYVRGDKGATPRPLKETYYDDPYEDFAESVAITVYPNAPGANSKFVNGKRYNYIQQQFKDYRALETS